MLLGAMTRPIMLYDGECAMCTGAVQFVLDHEREPTFLFASLQSPRGRRELARFGLDTERFDSFVVVEGDQCFVKMRASLRLGHHIGGPFRVAARLASVTPLPLGDAIYSWVFRNRITWFGRANNCRVTDDVTKARFVDAVAV